MQFLKVLGLLFLLVTSNLAFAISIDEERHYQEDYSNSLHFNEELQDLGESSLIGPSGLLVLEPISAFTLPESDFSLVNP